MNLRDPNLIRITLLLAAIGLAGFFWSSPSPDPGPGPRTATATAPAPVAAQPMAPVAKPPQRQRVEPDEPVEAITRERWAQDAKLLQRELIEAVLRGDEAAVERAQAKARALAARSAAAATSPSTARRW